ncbi:MAG: hypothetical protein HQK86_01760 [Nitrospinae bacterium]|nr:hypothetical protein [Nitrospinota bacterium]MBF0633827.1 hypothetical protein [Nitrospinota bacterium]
MKKKNVIEGKAKVTAEKAIKIAEKIVRDETVMLRVTRERKTELERRAKRAGVSLSSYLLQAEDKYAHMGVTE